MAPFAALLLLALAATGLAAQGSEGAPNEIPPRTPGDGFSRLYLNAGVGLLTPLADLAPNTRTSPTAPRDPAPVLSVGVSWHGSVTYFLTPMFGFAVTGTFSSPDVDLQEVQTPGQEPDEAGSQLGTADFFAGSGELVFRPLGAPDGSPLDPYFALGGGVRDLSFSDPSLEDGTDPMGTVAGGVRTSVAGPVFWSLEMRSFFSSADPTPRGGRRQSDVVVTVGLGARL